MKRAVFIFILTGVFFLDATLGSVFKVWAEDLPEELPAVEEPSPVPENEPTLAEPEPVLDPILSPDPLPETEPGIEEMPNQEPMAEEPMDPPLVPEPTDPNSQEPVLPQENLNPDEVQADPLPPQDLPLEENPANLEEIPEQPAPEMIPIDPVPIDPTPSPEPIPVVLPKLLINEVMLGSEINPEKDDWIELYNPGDEEVLLEGWQIRGVTKGGTWIDIVAGQGAVQPKSYYLLSHYTNSTSSALAIKPQSTKTSIDFTNDLIHIELKNAQNEIIDRVEFASQPLLNDLNAPLYRSYERLSPASDGMLAQNWSRASSQVNLKQNLVATFATPGAINSHESLLEPVRNLKYELIPVPCPEPIHVNECLPGETFLAQFTWENPESAQSIHVSQVDEWGEAWQERITVPASEEPFFQIELMGLKTTAFQFVAYDSWGRPGESEDVWVDFSPKVLINEFFADPLKNDAKEEFVELKNVGLVPVDLSGWELATHLESETEDDLYLFNDENRLFSKDPTYDYVLLPGEYFTLYADESLLRLSNAEGSLSLFDQEGNLVDELAYAGYLSGYSHGRLVDTPDVWGFFFHPTPGKANLDLNTPPVAVADFQKSTYMTMNVTGENSYDADGDALTFLWTGDEGFYSDQKNPGAFTFSQPGIKRITLTVIDAYGDSKRIVFTFEAKLKNEDLLEETLVSYPTHQLLNEIMVNPEGSDTENEWVELYNSTSSSIDLSGWYVDDDEGASAPEKIPEGTLLAPGQFWVMKAPGLSFKNTEDVVRLLDPNKEPTQIVHYTSAQEAFTFAKNSQGDFVWTPLTTPGKKNEFPPPPKAYTTSSVTFQRVLPNPNGADGEKEKVVIKNNLSEKIDLTGWVLEDGQNHQTNLHGFTLPPHQSLTLTGDEIGFSLNNSDESLTLYDPTGQLIDTIAWKEVGAGQWLVDPSLFEEGMQVRVVQVIDGDTFKFMLDDGTLFTTRLLGIDTPETVHPFKPLQFYGQEASQFLKQLLTGQTVTLGFDANKFDKYGRVLSYVYLADGTLVNAQVLQQGYGYVYTRFPFKYMEDFIRYENEAKAAGLGLWEHEEIREIMEEMIEEEKEKWEEEELLEEELLEEELIVLQEEELLEEDQPDLLNEGEEVMQENESLEAWLDCALGDLKIEAFMPAPEKGKEEWIRLINVGENEVCLAAWQLDDVENAGSKPFTLKNEKLAPGAVRTFYKSETKLNLNNKNDSVRLLNPLGKEVDRIDYIKTHKNEIFTHKGGDWVPKKRVKKSSTGSKTKRHKFDREVIAYQYEWVNERLHGSFELAPDEGGLYVHTLQNEVLFVRSLPDQLDWAMVDLLGEGGGWEFQVHEDSTGRDLVGIAFLHSQDFLKKDNVALNKGLQS